MHPIQRVLRLLLEHDYEEAARLCGEHLRGEPDDPVALALRSFALGNLLMGKLSAARREELQQEHLAHASQVLEHLSPERFTEDETIRQVQHAALADAYATLARRRYNTAAGARDPKKDVDEALALAIAGEQACGLTRPLLEVQALCLLRLGREREAQELIAQVITDPPETTRAFLEDVARATAARPGEV